MSIFSEEVHTSQAEIEMIARAPLAPNEISNNRYFSAIFKMDESGTLAFQIFTMNIIFFQNSSTCIWNPVHNLLKFLEAHFQLPAMKLGLWLILD